MAEPTPTPPRPTPRKYLFVGGGSGGHTVPLLAVRQALLRKEPTAEIRFLSSEKQLDREFLEREKVAYDSVPYPRLDASFLPSFWKNYMTAARIIRNWKPDVVFSKGGALSIPACIVARMKGIPVVLHESDAVMGNANRFVSTLATRICLGFPTPYALPPTTSFTGNPVREQMAHGSREEGLRLTGLGGTRPIVLIMGGSQGAQSINETTWAELKRVIGQAIEAGAGINDSEEYGPGIASLVREVMGSRIRSSGETIARTEIHGAFETAGRLAIKDAADELGLRYLKEWVSALDDRVRDDHADAHGQTVGIDEEYEVGGTRGMAPGEMGEADQDINCRCTSKYIVDRS